jgi:hypothetical protein
MTDARCVTDARAPNADAGNALRGRRRGQPICCAILVALAAAPVHAAARPAPRELTWEAPAAGLATLTLDAGNGEVEVVGVAADRVRVSVRADLRRWSDDEPWRRAIGWFLRSDYEEDAALMKALRLDPERTTDELALRLAPGGRTRTNRVAERWRVEVPVGARVAVRLDSGDVTIRGVTGGVRVRLGAGDASVLAPEGDLDVEVAVGKVDITFGSSSTREVELASQVGDTKLWVAGNRIEHPREPGPGNRTSLHGSGRYRVEASVSVGDVVVRIGDA